MTAPTLTSFRAQAIAAAQERRQQTQNEIDAAERRRVDELRGFMVEGLEVIDADLPRRATLAMASDSHDQQRYPIATVDDDVTLTVRHALGRYGYDLYLILPCPQCGVDTTYCVRALADIGTYLEPDASRDVCARCDG